MVGVSSALLLSSTSNGTTTTSTESTSLLSSSSTTTSPEEYSATTTITTENDGILIPAARNDEENTITNNNNNHSDTNANSTTITSSDVTNSSSSNTVNNILIHEMELPWPSTFERSVALLSSPIQPIQNITLYTKSPKPGYNMISSSSIIAARNDHNNRYDLNDIEDTRQQQQSLARVKSMDFWNKQQQQQPLLSSSTDQRDTIIVNNRLKTVEIKQQQRLNAANEYRQKILQQQQQQKQKQHKTNTKTTTSNNNNSNKATFYQCTFNLANILMGVGLLGLPYVYKVSGYYGGTFCILTFGSITWYTSILIGRTLNGDPKPSYYFQKEYNNNNNNNTINTSSMCPRLLPRITSFPDIARTAFGNIGCILLSLVLYFELFSCIAIFFVSIGDHLHQLIPIYTTTIHMIIVSCISIIPTIVLRTPALLSYLSMVGTFATTAVVLSVITSAIFEGNIASEVVLREQLQDNITPPYHIKWKSDGLPLAFGLVAYCFSGHAIIPSIYTSMEKPHEFDTMVTYTFIVVIICCLAVAISGYYIFGATVQDQVTLSLERSSSAVTAMQALTWLMIMTAFSKITLTMFPLALGMEEIVAPYLSSERMVDIASSTIKFMLTMLALCVSIYFPSFSLLCSMVGIICSMTVSVIFPAAAHLKLFGKHLSILEIVIDWILIIFGIIMGVAGTFATIQ